MFQIQVIPAVKSPKTAHLTENQREKTRNKNRHLEPDYLGQEDIALANHSTCNYDFYDDDVLKDEFYEEYDEDTGTHLDALVRLLARRTIEEVCIYCLVFIDEITGEEIGNAMQTSREMPRLRARQIAEKISADKHADNHLFDPDNETMETIKNVVYASSDEKLDYLYASSADKKKSTRGRYKASLRAETSLFDAMGV
jgi:hypothetical protein